MRPGVSDRRLLLARFLALPGMSVLSALGWVGVAHGASAREAATSEPPATAGRYLRTAPSADGIGKLYMGREIAGVMGWQAAAWLEREEREREERGDILLRELALRPGLDVADIGAGTGYYSRRIAQQVAPGGTVYAVDVQPQMLALLEDTVRKAGIANVRPVLATATDTRLAPGSIDLAIMVDVYHELEFPFEVVGSVVRALRAGGCIVWVEYRAEDAGVPIKRLHKMSEAQVRREAAVHGLQWERSAEGLPWQHAIVFRKPATTGPATGNAPAGVR